MEEPASKISMADGHAYIEQVVTKNKQKKVLLDGIKLDFPANSLTAILGPSGAGKTTLLDVITDSIPSTVTARGFVDLPGHSAMTPQEDTLHGFYTCKSYMQHYARLTGIGNKKDTADRIDTILQELGLWDQRDTIVGDLFLKGLSGGQKRRLSIALEALTQPQNFFLDEPTSGLDAESALQIMEFLKKYAREGQGRRVILTIHQPSSFIWKTIDYVVLLSKGKLMYNGVRENMESFFSEAGHPTPIGWNPADHYVTAVNDEFRNHLMDVEEWAEKFVAWRKNQEMTHLSTSMRMGQQSDHISTSRSKSLIVVFELIYRYFLNLFFNPGILGTRIAMYSMLALMVGALFWDLGERDDLESVQSRIAVSFYCVAFFIFMSVAVLPFTVMERAIVDKEVKNGYYPPVAYQIAQFVSSIPGAAILAGLVALIIITMTKMNDPGWYFLTMFLSLTVAEALAQMVSHFVPHFVIGMALLAGLYGFFMLYQGFMLTRSDFPDWLAWLYYVAPHSYAWRTFMVTEFRGATFTGSDVFQTGEDVLTFYEIEDTDRSDDMIVLAGYAIVVQLLAVLALQLRYSLFKGKLEPPSTA